MSDGVRRSLRRLEMQMSNVQRENFQLASLMLGKRPISPEGKIEMCVIFVHEKN